MVLKVIVKPLAKKVCSFIEDSGKRRRCEELIEKLLMYGSSVVNQVKPEIEKNFTPSEREEMKKRLSQLMSELS